MIFADKLIKLRKQKGWSQEELAEKMDVTRQSVSKWEGEQSIPEIEKIIQLSNLFNVTTDYLLKDEIEEEEEKENIRKVSMEDALEFLSIKRQSAKQIAIGVFLCIISPIFLLLSVAIVEEYGFIENIVGFGLIVLLIFVAIAVAIFISTGSKTSKFKFLEKEIFELDYGVNNMVNKRKEEYRNTYTQNNIVGTCTCILSAIPLFIGIIINENDDLMMVKMLCITILLAGIGVVFFIRVGVVWASFEKLLQEGEYTKANKEVKTISEAISTIYWLIITSIYLSYSFITNNWDKSWIIWMIAGILYPIIINIFNIAQKDKE